MSITNLQQARQMYAMGQRVAKTLDGSRPGYRGDAAYGRSSRSSQATSIGQARGATGKGGGASLGGGRDRNEQPAQQFIGGKSYNVTPETRGDRDRAQLKQQILNQTKVGGNRIDKFGNTKKSPFRQGGGLGSLLMGALGMFMGIPGLGLITGGLGNLKGKLGDAFGNFNRKMRGVNPDGTTRTQAQYEQSMYDKRQQNRVAKLLEARDRGYNQIGFGDFTKKTVDFTPNQQALLNDLIAQGYGPSSLNNPNPTFETGNPDMNLNDVQSLVSASQKPQSDFEYLGSNFNDGQLMDYQDIGIASDSYNYPDRRQLVNSGTITPLEDDFIGQQPQEGVMGIDVGYPSNDLMAFAPNSRRDRALKNLYSGYENLGIENPQMIDLMQQDLQENQEKGTPLSLPQNAYSLIG